MAELKHIVCGLSDLSMIRKTQYLFVDKTAKLQELVELRKVFLARPRRMGKTTLVSMLQDLFTNGTENFKDKAIHDLWQEDQYPVIKLSFGGIVDPDKFEKKLCSRLRTAFVKAGFAISDTVTACNTLDDLLEKLELLKGDQTVVVLIDEWDYPLSANLDNRDAFERCRAIMHTFYFWLRELSGLWFLLVTGIGRYRDSSLFTGADIRDISFEPQFADIVGYTQQELETWFDPYLAEAARRLKIGRAELLAKLHSQYDGFCFDRNASISLYCPWSVNQFFEQLVRGNPEKVPMFWCFWTEAANCYLALRTLLQRDKPDLCLLSQLHGDGVAVTEEQIITPTDLDQIKLAPLLVALGYLSIKAVVNPLAQSPLHRTYCCSYSNQEIEIELVNVFLEYVASCQGPGAVKAINLAARQLGQALYAHDMAQVGANLNLILHALHCEAWSNTHETVYRALIANYLCISGGAGFVQEEKGNQLGRSAIKADIETDIGSRHYLIELKLVADSHDPEATKLLAHKAQQQMVEQGYGDNKNPAIERCYGLVLVIDNSTRQIAYWRRYFMAQVLDEGMVAPVT
ncbi:MAG TPA: AAA family ATPase [Candidatus Anaerobiospirillum stercoravium]|nr:AAA family ATPase [Candidatus Anaerobiospirillum stercoravium]